MNTQKIAKGWALIAEGAMELSLAYESLDTPVARAGVDPAAEGAPVPSPAPSSAAVYETNPFDEGAAFTTVPPAKTLQEQHVETVLSQCPDHQVAWTVKAGGIAKDGKPYASFWRCAQQTNGNYCRKRPVKAWIDKHPISEGVAA